MLHLAKKNGDCCSKVFLLRLVLNVRAFCLPSHLSDNGYILNHTNISVSYIPRWQEDGGPFLLKQRLSLSRERCAVTVSRLCSDSQNFPSRRSQTPHSPTPSRGRRWLISSGFHEMPVCRVEDGNWTFLLLQSLFLANEYFDVYESIIILYVCALNWILICVDTATSTESGNSRVKQKLATVQLVYSDGYMLYSNLLYSHKSLWRCLVWLLWKPLSQSGTKHCSPFLSSLAPFCQNMYLDMVSTTGGAIAWAFLKPMLMGQILFTPDTPVTRAIMEKVFSTFGVHEQSIHITVDIWSQRHNTCQLTIIYYLYILIFLVLKSSEIT